MAQKQPLAELVENDAEISCMHHWVIQAATGPVSPGVCQTCGETRDFKNYVEASTWGADKSQNKAKAAEAQKSNNKGSDNKKSDTEAAEDNGA